MTALRVNESSGSIGSLQIADGHGGFLSGSISVTSGMTIQDDGIGNFTLGIDPNTSTVIGEAEDGTYTDGLFTDFNPQTPVGVAVDRFNEILALLAPAPAPNVQEIQTDTTQGDNVYLSFGQSNNIEISDSYFNVLGFTDYGTKDVNDLFEADTSQSDIRMGSYGSKPTITGIVNDSVLADGTNYPNDAFGNADNGTLKLIVNNATVHTVDLSSFASGDSLDPQTNSGFTNILIATSGQLSNGTSFPNFKHRTAEYIITPSTQRQGWNWAKVVHEVGSVSYETNYIEWINDEDSSLLNANNQGMLFSGNGSVYLSGINYFTGGSTQYRVKIDNLYQKVYDKNDISFTATTSGLNQNSSISFSPVQKPTIDTQAGEDHTKSLHLTASSNVNTDYILGGTITAGVNATHPFKSSLINAGTATAPEVLLYNLTNTSTNYVETFLKENLRYQSGSYDTQAVVQNSHWDSTRHITGSNLGHSDGLQYFATRLHSPLNTLNGGDFSGFFNGPQNNPDYSGETGLRTFYRAFLNNENQDVYNLKLTINGTATTIVPRGDSLDSGKIRVFFKIPEKTGWMDIAQNFSYQSTNDDDGCQALTLDSSINTQSVNYLTFGTVSLSQNEYIIMKIEADISWVGDINQIQVVLPGGTGQVDPVVDLTNIDSDNTGVTGKLSFGSSKSITGYTNVGSTAGYVSKDLNDSYDAPSSNTDYRRGIFDATQDMTGRLNEIVTSVNPDYPNDAFFRGNEGQLILELNGTEIHSVDLDTFGSGATGSGTYFNLSSWAPAKFDNNVPDYLNVYRTGTYAISSTQQEITNGWNYARVIHRVDGIDTTTNYVEWVNDSAGQNDDITSTVESIGEFSDSNLFYLSGVKYFTSPTGIIKAKIDNLYTNVYSGDSNAVSVTAVQNCSCTQIEMQGSGLTSPKTSSGATATLQSLNTTLLSENTSLNVTGSLTFTQSTSISGSFEANPKTVSAYMSFRHPLKNNLTATTLESSPLLVFNPSETSNENLSETFTGETYRLVAGNYNNQSDVLLGAWNSQISINDGNNSDYLDGLMVHGNKVISPLAGGNAGDFRNTNDGGVFEGPDNNVNYSSLTQNERIYLRSFKNLTTNDVASITISLSGEATLVSKNTTLTDDKIHVEIKTPGKTGWMDLGLPTDGSSADGSGCYVGNLTSSITTSGVSNVCSFGVTTVNGSNSGSEYFVIKISADKSWDGYIENITVSWSS